MKVLTIQQPFASLIIIGAKHYETRRWLTDYRGELLIHAGRHFNESNKRLFYTEPYFSILENAGIWQFNELPLGCILGSVTLGCVEPTWQIAGWQTEQELGCGFWKPGNYAFRLDKPRQWDRAYAVAGQPNLWEIDDVLIDIHMAEVDCLVG